MGLIQSCPNANLRFISFSIFIRDGVFDNLKKNLGCLTNKPESLHKMVSSSTLHCSFVSSWCYTGRRSYDLGPCSGTTPVKPKPKPLGMMPASQVVFRRALIYHGIYRVGGFNLFEKYESNWESSPNTNENKIRFETTT